jgi:hypothetical protein
MNESTKRCIFCGEQILAIAIKCKHCQSILDVGSHNEFKPQLKKSQNNFEKTDIRTLPLSRQEVLSTIQLLSSKLKSNLLYSCYHRIILALANNPDQAIEVASILRPKLGALTDQQLMVLDLIDKLNMELLDTNSDKRLPKEEENLLETLKKQGLSFLDAVAKGDRDRTEQLMLYWKQKTVKTETNGEYDFHSLQGSITNIEENKLRVKDIKTKGGDYSGNLFKLNGSNEEHKKQNRNLLEKITSIMWLFSKKNGNLVAIAALGIPLTILYFSYKFNMNQTDENKIVKKGSSVEPRETANHKFDLVLKPLSCQQERHKSTVSIEFSNKTVKSLTLEGYLNAKGNGGKQLGVSYMQLSLDRGGVLRKDLTIFSVRCTDIEYFEVSSLSSLKFDNKESTSGEAENFKIYSDFNKSNFAISSEAIGQEGATINSSRHNTNASSFISKMQEGIEYKYFSNNKCEASAGVYCLSFDEWREVCKSAVVSRVAVEILGLSLGIIGGGLYTNGNVDTASISWTERGCYGRVEVSGIVSGTSKRESGGGMAIVFKKNSSGEVVSTYIDRWAP